MKLLKHLICKHEWQIFFRHPNVHKLLTVELPKGNVPNFPYAEKASIPDFSGRVKMKLCPKCGKEEVVK